jgi:sec-independent protein translocase protein TatA
MIRGIFIEIFNIGGPEMMVIMFIGLLLFGGKKLPELARGLGKGIREFKDASDGVKREIQRNIDAVQNEVDSARKEIEQEPVPQLKEPVTGEQTHLN